MTDIVIGHISFGEGAVEIGYVEPRNQSEKAILHNTVVVDRSLIEQEIVACQEFIQIMVDRGLEAVRNPPASKPAYTLGS